jgi:two-component system, chemotaxis family, CheB/CheR fusion protein
MAIIVKSNEPSHGNESALTQLSITVDHSAKEQPLMQRSALVVVIGASAGGVEALSRFFDAMPPDSGAAFVIVLHLDPTRESQMAHVLSSHTKMSVVQLPTTWRLIRTPYM